VAVTALYVEKEGIISIGKPFANMEIHILDDWIIKFWPMVIESNWEKQRPH